MKLTPIDTPSTFVSLCVAELCGILHYSLIMDVVTVTFRQICSRRNPMVTPTCRYFDQDVQYAARGEVHSPMFVRFNCSCYIIPNWCTWAVGDGSGTDQFYNLSRCMQTSPMSSMGVLAASLHCIMAHFLCSFCTALQVSYRILVKYYGTLPAWMCLPCSQSSY